MYLKGKPSAMSCLMDSLFRREFFVCPIPFCWPSKDGLAENVRDFRVQHENRREKWSGNTRFAESSMCFSVHASSTFAKCLPLLRYMGYLCHALTEQQAVAVPLLSQRKGLGWAALWSGSRYARRIAHNSRRITVCAESLVLRASAQVSIMRILFLPNALLLSMCSTSPDCEAPTFCDGATWQHPAPSLVPTANFCSTVCSC